jgi:hypothetical protein
MGQLFMMGFDGTTVDSWIRSLIEKYHLGSILLTAKNLKCMIPSADWSHYRPKLMDKQRRPMPHSLSSSYRPSHGMPAIPFRSPLPWTKRMAV